MGVLRTLLVDNGFKITADNVYTKAVYLPSGDPDKIAEHINSCRNANGFMDYKIVPFGSYVLVATDYKYSEEMDMLVTYANEQIRQDYDKNYRHIRSCNEFNVISVYGKLVYKYTQTDYASWQPSEHADYRPELGKRILTYAAKILPKDIQPVNAIPQATEE